MYEISIFSCSLVSLLYVRSVCEYDGIDVLFLSVAHTAFNLSACQALGFHRFSLLGWSDGGITGLVVAARNPALIQKMVVWGSNTYVSQQDLDIYHGDSPAA